jgi:hypothetical protein
VFPLLKNDFEVGWYDIYKEDHVGYSYGYSQKKHCAVGTTNGAGAHNVQIFVLSADAVVMHALPGFWAPEDLARELQFAKALHHLWRDDSRSIAQKQDMFKRMQTAEPRHHPAATFARSAWQGFDESVERSQGEPRDTVLDAAAPASMPANLAQLLSQATTFNVRPGQPMMKPLNVLVHERMAVRPFVAFDQFDTAAFVDYGRLRYDLNVGHDGRGKKFPGQEAAATKRRIAAKRAAIAERKLAARQQRTNKS